jgi:hypothetical protein
MFHKYHLLNQLQVFMRYKKLTLHITFQTKKTKRLDVYSLFASEYLQIYRGNEIIQKSSFLKRLQNYL